MLLLHLRAEQEWEIAMVREGKMAQVTTCRKAEVKKPVTGNVRALSYGTALEMPGGTKQVPMVHIQRAQYDDTKQERLPIPAGYMDVKQVSFRMLEGRVPAVPERKPVRADKGITLEQLFSGGKDRLH